MAGNKKGFQLECTSAAFFPVPTQELGEKCKQIHFSKSSGQHLNSPNSQYLH